MARVRKQVKLTGDHLSVHSTERVVQQDELGISISSPGQGHTLLLSSR